MGVKPSASETVPHRAELLHSATWLPAGPQFLRLEFSFQRTEIVTNVKRAAIARTDGLRLFGGEPLAALRAFQIGDLAMEEPESLHG